MVLMIEDLLLGIFEVLEDNIDPWNRPASYNRSFMPECPPSSLIKDQYDLKFLWDIGYKVKFNQTISSKQADLLIKILSKYKPALNKVGFPAESIDFALTNPTFKNKPYQSKEIPREVRYIGQGLLAFRCLYNPKIIGDIRKIQGQVHHETFDEIDTIESSFDSEIRFNPVYKIWIVEVTEHNMNKVMRLIKGFSFSFDEDVENFFLEAENTKTNPSVVTIEEDMINIDIYNDKLLSSWIETNDLLGDANA
jgi:hypothetical protein